MTSITYAIGDVHGRSDLLAKLIEFIDGRSKRLELQPRVCFLGDIVDKGPDSRGAMDIVCETIRRWPGSQLVIGNHDFLFLDAMTRQRLVGGWYARGARSTLLSYSGYDDHTSRDLTDLGLLYPEHLHVLSKASELALDGQYAFVHAGIDPTMSVYRQNRNVLLQTRAKFMDHIGHLSHIVVHGHSVLEVPRPVVTENRISLDTDAWQTGILSMVEIDSDTDRLKFFATSPDGNVAAVEPIVLDRGLGTVLDGARQTARVKEDVLAL